MRRRTDPDVRSEQGFSVLELTIASMLLIVLLAATLNTLHSSMAASGFAARRNTTVDELRTAANRWANDVRQGSTVTGPSTSSLTVSTFVGGTAQDVTWRITGPVDGKYTLERGDGTTFRSMVSDLTTDAAFSYNRNGDDPITVPGTPVTDVEMILRAKPDKQPAVVVTTFVELRNAS